nr:zonular occludens toxin domain-containing protein [uncultured Albidiferax sp.]
MITLETGVPGAGKTLYCVDKLLRPLVGATVKHENSDGQVVDILRTIFTNINGLLLEHEKIGPDELNTWHTWAKPGSVIVYDEIQKPWPLAATGSKVPECIQALETHRHMGVDFIVLTQHPMLIHANLVRLVGRHLHVRRMGNMGLAIVYEWDSASRTLLYKNALAKSPWKYSKSAQQLYKSAELHTKQPRRTPTLLFVVLAALVGLGFMFPQAYASLQARIDPSSRQVSAPAKTTPMVTAARPATLPPGGQAPSLQANTGMPIKQPPAVDEVAGCVSMAGLCSCYDGSSKKVDKPIDYCLDQTGQRNPIPKRDIPTTLAEYVPVIPRKDERNFTLPKPQFKGSTVADVVAKYR